MRLGLFGGTFDPIHFGHLIVAEEVRIQLGLDEVVLIPTGQPWMKVQRPLSSSKKRLDMVRLAVSCNPFFQTSSIEVDRPGPTYTVDTLRSFREGMRAEDDIYFIIGMDSLKSFHLWKEPDKVLGLCNLAVVSRPGCEAYDLSALDTIVDGGSQGAVSLRTPLIDLSGTRIRARAAKGQSIRYQVPSLVERYIRQHQLYLEGEEVR